MDKNKKFRGDGNQARMDTILTLQNKRHANGSCCFDALRVSALSPREGFLRTIRTLHLEPGRTFCDDAGATAECSGGLSQNAHDDDLKNALADVARPWCVVQYASAVFIAPEARMKIAKPGEHLREQPLAFIKAQEELPFAR